MILQDGIPWTTRFFSAKTIRYFVGLILCQIFTSSRTYAIENLEFLRAVQRFNKSGSSEEGVRIVERFLMPQAPDELHIDASLRMPLVRKVEEGATLKEGAIS